MAMRPMIQGRPVTILSYNAPREQGVWHGTWVDDPDGPVWAVDDDQLDWADDTGICPATGESHQFEWHEGGGDSRSGYACAECRAAPDDDGPVAA